MQYRKLGNSDLRPSALGLGCMGMSEFYGQTDDQQSIKVILRAHELGVNFFDTADIYGFGHNETLLGQAIADFRDDVIVASKCGIVRDPQNPNARHLNGSADYIKACCHASLQRLGIERIDLFYLHRIDPQTPIEESVAAMADLVRSGKVRYLGLSEASADIISRAHQVHPITAVQSEYSLWSREVEKSVLKTCRKLGIGFVPYSPIGRGFLSGKVLDAAKLEDSDFRKRLPRFQGENLEKNLIIVKQLLALAAEKGCSPVQLALAWVLAQGEDIVPIPGTRRIQYLEENLGALAVVLSAAELQQLDQIFSLTNIAGERYPAEMMQIYSQKDAEK